MMARIECELISETRKLAQRLHLNPDYVLCPYMNNPKACDGTACKVTGKSRLKGTLFGEVKYKTTMKEDTVKWGF